MTSIILHPTLVFVISVVGLWIAAVSGAYLNKRRRFSEGMRHEFGIILAATLTLLGPVSYTHLTLPTIYSV